MTLAGVIAGGIVAAWYVAVYEPGDIGLWLYQSRIGVKRTLTLYVAEMAKFFIQLTAELMPAPLLVVPFYWSIRKELRAGTDAGPTAQLALALLLYASLVSVVLAFWPGGSNTRYAIPAVPAVATAAGLAFDRVRSEIPRLANFSLAVLVGLAVYQITIGWILMPNFPGPYAKSRITGSFMEAAIETHPAAMLYSVGVDAPLAYVPSHIRRIEPAELASVEAPAWVVVTREQLDLLRQTRPELRTSVRLIMSYYNDTLLVFLDRRDQSGE